MNNHRHMLLSPLKRLTFTLNNYRHMLLSPLKRLTFTC